MDLGIIGWLVVGFLAGSISGWFVRDSVAKGCLPTIVVGIIGGFLGGWISRQLGFGDVEGLIGALIFATGGAIIVRLVLRALD